MARSVSEHIAPETLIAEGREALLAGDKARAQSVLMSVVQIDPQNEEAWMWLSGTYTAPEDMAACLHTVLTINPANEQAQEGLHWLETEYGLTQSAPIPETPAPPPESVSFHPRYESQRSASTLLESALHPLATGALLGLLRLVSWLRPETLVLMGGGVRPLDYTGALNVAATAAGLHGLALLVVWLVSAWRLNQIRVDGRGDLFDSLVRAGRLWMPGYLWGGALVAAALALRLGPLPWRIIAVLCWILVLAGTALIVRQLWRLLEDVAVPYHKRTVTAGRVVLMSLVVMVLSLGLAGIVTAAVLR